MYLWGTKALRQIRNGSSVQSCNDLEYLKQLINHEDLPQTFPRPTITPPHAWASKQNCEYARNTTNRFSSLSVSYFAYLNQFLRITLKCYFNARVFPKILFLCISDVIFWDVTLDLKLTNNKKYLTTILVSLWTLK